MSGTTPKGTHSEEQAAAWVREMFGKVAPRYDFLNHLLSLNIDRSWRARTVRRVQDILRRPDARVLDVCCGTGDLMLAMRKAALARVFGSDFSHPMLTAAKSKGGDDTSWFESDALRLPVPDRSLDLITAAFGFRNLINYERGLAEFRRALRPGGTVALLEFSQPPNPLFAAVYGLYSKTVLPRIGGLISGSRDAYTYLPESVQKFPDAGGLARMMESAGFHSVRYERMTFGIVALHLGIRP
jgi:demethylmenaquinone methyltransferase/2-methoxy-6-polyprenyl-1,4-benzoquinol methylase